MVSYPVIVAVTKMNVAIRWLKLFENKVSEFTSLLYETSG